MDSFKRGLFKTLIILEDYLPDIVIAGGWVPLIYYHYLLSDKEKEPLMTKDIDLVVPEKLKERGKTIDEVLKESGFRPVFKSHDTPPVVSYEGNIEGYEIEIEFLTHQRGPKEERVIKVQKGLHAQALRFISLLIENTLLVKIDDFPLVNDEVLKVKVPTPGAFIFHKGLIFTRRRRNFKKAKDLYYIFDILANCEELHKQIIDEFREFKNAYFSWFKNFLRNLKRYFLSEATEGVYLVKNQRPEGAFLRLNDEQFQQYVLGIFQEFIEELDAL